MIKKTILAISCASILGACSSNLKVYQDDPNNSTKAVDAAGIPFMMTIPYVKTGIYTRHKEKGKNCEKAPFIDIIPVPMGKKYYVTIETGAFSDASLTYKTNPNGSIQEITMTSKPDSSAIDSATSAITSLLPYVGILPKQQSAASTGGTDGDGSQNPLSDSEQDRVSCNTGEADVVLTRMTANPETVFNPTGKDEGTDNKVEELKKADLDEPTAIKPSEKGKGDK